MTCAFSRLKCNNLKYFLGLVILSLWNLFRATDDRWATWSRWPSFRWLHPLPSSQIGHAKYILTVQKVSMYDDYTLYGCKLPRALENPLDDLLMVAVEPLLQPLHRAGVTPNMVTVGSMLSAVMSVFLCFKGKAALAAFLWLLNYTCDIVDGFLARRYEMETEFGGMLDHVSDVAAFGGLMSFVLWRCAHASLPVWPLWVEGGLLAGAWLHLHCQEKDTPHMAFDGIDGSACLNKSHLRYTRFFGTGTLTAWHLFLICFYSRR